MNNSIVRHTCARTDIPALLRDTADILIALDTEYTRELPEPPPPLGITPDGLSDAAHRRTHDRNRPLSYQWMAVETATGRRCSQLYLPTPAEPRLALGDIVRMAVLDLGFNRERLRRQNGATPLKVLIVWHWGSAEVGLCADREKLMGKESIVSLGGAIVSLKPVPLAIPLRDKHDHYGEVTLTLLDTSRLMDKDTTLEQLGEELGLPKIDVEAQGYAKDRMDILREQDPALFRHYAMRDCEIALTWLCRTAQTQEEVLHLEHMACTTGSASAAGLQAFLGPAFQERFATRYAHARQEYIPTPRRGENESYVIQAFIGAMNQSYHLGHVEGDIVDLDLDGAYASAMGIIPGIDWNVDAATEDTDPWQLTDLMTFVGVKFKFPAGTPFPCLPVWTEEHGPIYPLSNWEQCQATYVTGPELHEALLMGCQIKVVSARRFAPKGLLVCDYVRTLYQVRRAFPKGTAQNTAAKLAINALYGKMGQGIAHQCTNDEIFSDAELQAGKKIKRHAVTLPHAAAAITGLIRAVLGVVVREASQLGTVLSATTDGAMIRLAPGVERDVAMTRLLVACESHPAVQLLLQGRRNLGLPPAQWLEVKYEGREGSTIKTRMNWIGVNGRTVHEARVGFGRDPERPDYVPFSDLEVIVKERRHCYYTEELLNTIDDICPDPGKTAHAADITSYYQSREVNLTPDWKRLFNPNGTSRPFPNMDFYWRVRRVVDALGWDAWPDLVLYQLKQGKTTRLQLDRSIRRSVYHRIAVGNVPGYRLPAGTTFKQACQTLGIDTKTLSRLRG